MKIYVPVTAGMHPPDYKRGIPHICRKNLVEDDAKDDAEDDAEVSAMQRIEQ